MKGVRSLELGRSGLLFGPATGDRTEGIAGTEGESDASLRKRLAVPNDRRMWDIFRALDRGWTVEQVREPTNMDPWFLQQFAEIVDLKRTAEGGLETLTPEVMRRLKRAGFGDQEIAQAAGATESSSASAARASRSRRSTSAWIRARPSSSPSRRTCTARTSRRANQTRTARKKVMILGSGPNRIGQGIEFDYCCCHAAFALREEGFETVMINCNPETVSTDYDTADRLYFQPLTFEDVMAVIDTERSAGGEVSCLVQFGGQTPLKLALALQHAGVAILGTSPDSIDLAEDRERFAAFLSGLNITQPTSGTATSREEARAVAASIGFPVVVRPSYVLGGRAMAIVYDTATLDRYMTHAVDASPEHPVLVDRFLEDAFEFDVDAVADTTGAVIIGGIMEHIEEAGIHSGDSSCVVPPFLCPERHLQTIREYTRRIARALEGRRPDERPVRHQGRRRVRDRGEPARVAHRAVPVEGGRHLAGEDRGQGHGRAHARRARPHARPRSRRRVREEPGVPVRPVPGRGHDPGPRDEVHRRSDGRRRATSAWRSRKRSCRSASGCRKAARRSSASTTTTRRTWCRSRATWPRSASA